MTDKELLKIVAGFRKGILGKEGPAGKCYKVSWPLQTFLNGCGIISKLIEVGIVQGSSVHSHYCLELRDGRILDATASQFTGPDQKQMPSIYLGERPTWYQELRMKKRRLKVKA